jgi:hypothetical protein
VEISRPIGEHSERLVGDRLNGFLYRKNTRTLSHGLIWRAVGSDPLRNERFLLVVQGQLFGTRLQILFAPTAQISPKTAICLRWDIVGCADIDGDVEDDAAVGSAKPGRSLEAPRQFSLVRFDFDAFPAEYHAKYPFKKDGVYVFVGEIPNMPGHCVVADHGTGRIYRGTTRRISSSYLETKSKGYAGRRADRQMPWKSRGMTESHCPICYGWLEVREVAPCFDCGAIPNEMEQLLGGKHTYSEVLVFNVPIVLCDFCQVDLSSYDPEYFNRPRGTKLGLDELTFVREVRNAAPAKDKFCPTCRRRLAFFDFSLKFALARKMYGSGTPKSLQIFLARPSLISVWRGTVDVWPAGPTKME